MILALETSSSSGSLAIGEAGRIVASRTWNGCRHSAALFSALRELSLSSLPIRTLLVGIGPGSFSSIRVSIAAAQAIAFCMGARLRSLCSAWSLAVQFPDVERLGIFADARRGELYGTLFSGGRLARPPFVFPREELSAQVEGLDLALSAEELGPGLRRAYPRAADFLRLEEESAAFSDDPFPEPIYLRGSVAEATGAFPRVS